MALANKETLVAGGRLVMDTAERENVDILPVDSEHSAIFQALQGKPSNRALKKIILTPPAARFRQDRAGARKSYRERCFKAPELVYGRKNNHRFRYNDE